MTPELIDVVTWAAMALLGLATYFLKGIHADIKKMREELHNQSKNQVRMETTMTDMERRLQRLEHRIEDQ